MLLSPLLGNDGTGGQCWGLAGHVSVDLVGLEKREADHLCCHDSTVVVKKRKEKKRNTLAGLVSICWTGRGLIIMCAGGHVVVIIGAVGGCC